MAYDLGRIATYALYGVGTAIAVFIGKKIYETIAGPKVPPKPDCSTEYQAFNHAGQRPLSQIKIIVLHDTDPPKVADPTARSTASYFSQHVPIKAGGPYSAHVVIGEDGCFETLTPDYIAYGAGEPANTVGYHIEQAGQAAWTREKWLSRTKTLQATAGLVASMANQLGIPLQFLKADDLKKLAAAGWPSGQGGVTTHAEISKAFPRGPLDHIDPGPNYPIDVLMGYATGQTPSPGQAIT